LIEHSTLHESYICAATEYGRWDSVDYNMQMSR